MSYTIVFFGDKDGFKYERNYRTAKGEKVPIQFKDHPKGWPVATKVPAKVAQNILRNTLYRNITGEESKLPQYSSRKIEEIANDTSYSPELPERRWKSTPPKPERLKPKDGVLESMYGAGAQPVEAQDEFAGPANTTPQLPFIGQNQNDKLLNE